MRCSSVSLPGGVFWYLYKYPQVQQWTNINLSKIHILLKMWIFADLTFQPEGYTIGYGLGQPEKTLTEYYTFLTDCSAETFCTQNSWVSLFYLLCTAVQNMDATWKILSRYRMVRPNCRNRMPMVLYQSILLEELWLRLCFQRRGVMLLGLHWRTLLFADALTLEETPLTWKSDEKEIEVGSRQATNDVAIAIKVYNVYCCCWPQRAVFGWRKGCFDAEKRLG